MPSPGSTTFTVRRRGPGNRPAAILLFEDAQPTAEWGNVFVPTKHKDHSCSELSAGGTARKELAGWIFSAEEHDTRPQVREQEVL